MSGGMLVSADQARLRASRQGHAKMGALPLLLSEPNDPDRVPGYGGWRLLPVGSLRLLPFAEYLPQ